MANKYVFQMRRGWKDDSTGRNDWAEYEAQPDHIKPLVGELVLEYDNGIPRLKIGDGDHEFSALPYMSVDSFILPKQSTITIYANKWFMADDNYNLIDKDGNIIDEEGNIVKENYYSVNENGSFIGDNGDVVKIRYAQHVDVNNATITVNSKVDLNPTPEMLTIYHDKDLTFVAENDDGNVWVYCIGQSPQNTYTIPCTITEITVGQ